MKPVPNRATLSKAAEARRKAESAALFESSGKFKTGANQNPATKRARTRSAAKGKAIREDLS